MPEPIPYWPVAESQAVESEALRPNRAEVVKRSLVRRGWIAVGIGVLIPFAEILAIVIAQSLRKAGHRQGRPMLIIASVILVLRTALYVVWT